MFWFHLHNIPKAYEIIGFKDSDLGDNILKKRKGRVTTEVEESLLLGTGKGRWGGCAWEGLLGLGHAPFLHSGGANPCIVCWHIFLSVCCSSYFLKESLKFLFLTISLKTNFLYLKCFYFWFSIIIHIHKPKRTLGENQKSGEKHHP